MHTSNPNRNYRVIAHRNVFQYRLEYYLHDGESGGKVVQEAFGSECSHPGRSSTRSLTGLASWYTKGARQSIHGECFFDGGGLSF